MKGNGKGEKKNKAMAKWPPWLELQDDIWMNILIRLGAIERLLIAQKVCTTWWRVLKEPSMWHVIDVSNCRGLSDSSMFQELCSNPVDRSQGELGDITFAFYATDELLAYVAERSPKLKRLSIAWCNTKLTHKFLVGVVNKLPLLEEFSLTHTAIAMEGIKALGRSCPRLESFELKNICCNVKLGDNEALATSKSLPALRHLQLIRNSMTNKGLQAILDGCPNLESLDLRGCLYVSLDKVLSSRISRQIKDVKQPHDSLVGFKF